MSVIWTPLPAGRRSDGAAVLSILVSPRLTTDGAGRSTLAAFAPFADWPATLRGLTPAVAFDGGADITVALADPAALSSALWRAMFPLADTAVAGHVPENFSAFEVTTFPVVAGRDALRSLYADSAYQYSHGPPDNVEDIDGLRQHHPEAWEIAAQVLAFRNRGHRPIGACARRRPSGAARLSRARRRPRRSPRGHAPPGPAVRRHHPRTRRCPTRAR